jgi:hypothetical protein
VMTSAESRAPKTGACGLFALTPRGKALIDSAFRKHSKDASLLTLLMVHESILISRINLWNQVGAGLIRVRFGKRWRIIEWVWIGIRWWQFGFWILHRDSSSGLRDLEHASI